MVKKRVCFLAYAEYYNDARIKSYVNALIEDDFAVDLFCLYDPYSNTSNVKGLFIYSLGKKYQGDNKVLYLLNYLFFLIKSFFYLSINFIRKNYSVFHIHNQPDLLVFFGNNSKNIWEKNYPGSPRYNDSRRSFKI